MTLTGDSTILVPVDVSNTEPPDQVILDLLRPVNLVVLGYYPVPKQTAPAHLKEDHEEEAAARLDNIVQKFAAGDHDVESVLVFTKEREDTIDRIADQYECDASRIMFGTVAERISQEATSNVGIVRGAE